MNSTPRCVIKGSAWHQRDYRPLLNRGVSIGFVEWEHDLRVVALEELLMPLVITMSAYASSARISWRVMLSRASLVATNSGYPKGQIPSRSYNRPPA